MDKKVKAACAEVDGIDYKGRYAADYKKFHFVIMYQVVIYEKLLEVLLGPKMPPRDYKKLTHVVFEVLRGPLT